MAHLVALPEPRPEDDEDVVWGLQTARTLWTRGERRDAIVWLRRAADAATAAGQDFRASELGMYATEIEDALTDGAAAAPDTIAEPPAEPPPEPPPARPPLASLDIQLEDEPARVPPAAPPPAPPPARPPAPTGAPRGFPAAPTLPTGVPPPRGAAPPAPPLPRPAGPPSAAPAAAAPPLTPLNAPASFAPPPAPAPPQPSAPAAGSAHPPSAAPPPPPAPAPAEVASSAPPIAAPAPPAAAGSAPAASASQPKRKKAKPRAPILDPWSEEPAPSQNVAPAAAAPAARTAKIGARAPEPSMNEEEVVTSAVPLDIALGKPAARPPPPPRRQAPTLPAVEGAVSSAPPVPPPVPAAAKRSSSAPPAASTPGAERVSPPAAPAPRAPQTSDAVSSAPPLTPAPSLGSAAPAAPPPVASTPPAAAAAPPTPAPVAPAPPLIASAPPPAPAAAAPTASATPTARAARDAQPASMRATVPDVGMGPRSEGRIAVTGVPVPQKAPVQPRVDPVPPLELPEEKRSVGGLALDTVDALADLPHEIQASLAASAKVEALRADEEVAGFGAALVLEGEGLVCATITDAPAHRAPAPALIAARGTLADGLAIRIVAGAAGARVAVWDQAFFDQALRSCPWVLDDLREGADRLQALAGATMGPLGDVDESTRSLALGRLSLRVLRPNEAFTAEGGPNPGMCIVGVGSIDLLDGGKVKSTLRAGDPVFAAEFLRAAPATADSRAGEAGAILFCADRALAQELLVSVPPLIEMFSG